MEGELGSLELEVKLQNRRGLGLLLFVLRVNKSESSDVVKHWL